MKCKWDIPTYNLKSPLAVRRLLDFLTSLLDFFSLKFPPKFPLEFAGKLTFEEFLDQIEVTV